MDSVDDILQWDDLFCNIPENHEKTLSDKFDLFMGLLFGIPGTIGGWWMFLSMFGFRPEFPGPFTILNAIIAMITIATLYACLIFGGPFVIRDAIKNYREED